MRGVQRREGFRGWRESRGKIRDCIAGVKGLVSQCHNIIAPLLVAHTNRGPPRSDRATDFWIFSPHV